MMVWWQARRDRVLVAAPPMSLERKRGREREGEIFSDGCDSASRMRSACSPPRVFARAIPEKGLVNLNKSPSFQHSLSDNRNKASAPFEQLAHVRHGLRPSDAIVDDVPPSLGPQSPQTLQRVFFGVVHHVMRAQLPNEALVLPRTDPDNRPGPKDPGRNLNAMDARPARSANDGDTHRLVPCGLTGVEEAVVDEGGVRCEPGERE